MHKDFVNNPPSSPVHIATKEPEIATDLIAKNHMRDDSCVSYADITNQLFWEVRRRNINYQRTSDEPVPFTSLRSAVPYSSADTYLLINVTIKCNHTLLMTLSQSFAIAID